MKKTIICSVCKINQKINTSYCRDCNLEYERKYRLKNKEKRAEYIKAYRTEEIKKKMQNMPNSMRLRIVKK